MRVCHVVLAQERHVRLCLSQPPGVIKVDGHPAYPNGLLALGRRELRTQRQYDRSGLHQRVDQNHLTKTTAHSHSGGSAATHPVSDQAPGSMLSFFLQISE